MAEKPTLLGEDSIAQGLLTALKEDEDALTEAHARLVEASARQDVASRRYAAMREAVRERLGVSPYSPNVSWPDTVPWEIGKRRKFRFRFTRLKIGDAVTEALDESDVPLTLEEIVSCLNSGGLYSRDTRAVNAALINTKGIVKTDDGKYSYVEDIDDLPF